MLKKITAVIASFGVLVTTAPAASALSCVQPDIRQSFNNWVDSPNNYYVAVGTLTPLRALPEIAAPNNHFQDRPVYKAPYRFNGHIVTAHGRQKLNTKVRVAVDCLGPWCGQFPTSGTKALMPLKIGKKNRLSLEVGPCPGSLFDYNIRRNVQTVRACMRNGRC